MTGPPALLFVYNADSGLMHGAIDLLHKLLSPATYPCRLCEVTYGVLGMRRAWATTLRALGLPARFLHRDEFAAAFPEATHPLPAAFLERDGGLEPILCAADFADIRSLEALERLLRARLAEHGLAADGG